MSKLNNGQRVRKLLAHNLKSIRRRLKMSQAELADKCGISTSFIAEIEICRKFPSPATLDKIADALNVQPYQLFLDEWRWEMRDQSGVIRHIHNEIKQRITREIDTVIEPYLNY